MKVATCGNCGRCFVIRKDDVKGRQCRSCWSTRLTYSELAAGSTELTTTKPTTLATDTARLIEATKESHPVGAPQLPQKQLSPQMEIITEIARFKILDNPYFTDDQKVAKLLQIDMMQEVLGKNRK